MWSYDLRCSNSAKMKEVPSNIYVPFDWFLERVKTAIPVKANYPHQDFHQPSNRPNISKTTFGPPYRLLLIPLYQWRAPLGITKHICQHPKKELKGWEKHATASFYNFLSPVIKLTKKICCHKSRCVSSSHISRPRQTLVARNREYWTKRYNYIMVARFSTSRTLELQLEWMQHQARYERCCKPTKGITPCNFM